MTEVAEGFDSWAIVEVMGFKKLAGHVTEQRIAGASLLRVDVPECITGVVAVPAYSKLIGVASIYMITPTDEATARKAAIVLAHQNDPLPIYIPPEQKQLRAQTDEEQEDAFWEAPADYEPDLTPTMQDSIDDELQREGDAAQAAEAT